MLLPRSRDRSRRLKEDPCRPLGQRAMPGLLDGATQLKNVLGILYNRTLTPVRDTDVTRAIQEFVFDHKGVKRFNLARQNRRVGS
jgi:hypothetical protein